MGNNSTISQYFWITGMRIFAWIILIGGIISGFILAVPFFDSDAPATGFVILLVAATTSFLTTAGIMIFLDISANVSQIKDMLLYKNAEFETEIDLFEKLETIDPMKALEVLPNLYEKGLITTEEYKAKKEELEDRVGIKV